MKKLVAVMMMAAALSTTVFAAAETETKAPTEVNWADVEGSVAEVEAEFVPIEEVGLKVWMPTILQPVELTDEDKEQGYIAYFMTADESAAIGIQYVDMGGITLDEYAAQLEENGASEVSPMIVNGNECLNYDVKDTDTTVLSYVTEAGYVLEFAFSPISDEGFAATAALVMSSIQAAE